MPTWLPLITIGVQIFRDDLGTICCFHRCESDIHKPPDRPVSKYSLRTRLFCLTCFQGVTLSAALHSGGLVSARVCLNLDRAVHLPQLCVCSLSYVRGCQSIFFVVCVEKVRARNSRECNSKCDCEPKELSCKGKNTK